jgi:hypothetical protein
MSGSGAANEAPGAEAPLSADQLLGLVYEELRKLAALKIGREAPGQTLH